MTSSMVPAKIHAITEPFLMTFNRGAGYMLLAGAAAFLVSFGILWAIGAERIDDLLDNISPALVIAIFAASAAGVAMSLASTVLITLLVRQKNQVRTAIDAM